MSLWGKEDLGIISDTVAILVSATSRAIPEALKLTVQNNIIPLLQNLVNLILVYS